ncbi:FAD-dependent oxidoreductase [Wohlfahrtiimonas chitiniclastica]|uniref:NAD(P)/FAD-dependent oxidoreductase n=1 Tax=Wohlfahrtiimonas chitiniclastica TaxID=400946 RepID=UPI000B98AA04|nr:FAD-dependent oxidoreductase [Wohlfahrtiimonas chitiniclastica]OYQ80464.1 FAD-dependent oxidoreductase [Wohlfahrtiimonas chitiniclastica]
MNDQNVVPLVIVGGGIIGLSIAVTLQAVGESVLLLDQSAIGAGASYGNAGHIATEQVFPVAEPSVLKHLPSMLFDPLGPLRVDWRYLPQLMPWGIQLLMNMRAKPFANIHQQLRLLNGVALRAWQQFSDQWKLSDLVKIQGSLLVAEKQTTCEQLKKHGDYLNSIGVINKWVNQNELHEMEPELANNQLGGIFYPETGHVVDLSVMIMRLTTHFIEMGGRILEHTKVVNLQHQADGTIELVCEGQRLYARKVVIACGAFSKPLVKKLSGINVPLETERGYHLMLPKEIGRLSIPVSSADRRFIMTPMTQGLRLAGTVEYGGLKLPANMKRAQNFIPLANPMLKEALDTTDSQEWMGFRPTIADSLPVIDRQGHCYYAFGHQHLGLTHAAITAELIKAMYFEQPTQIDCQGYSINRFI